MPKKLSKIIIFTISSLFIFISVGLGYITTQLFVNVNYSSGTTESTECIKITGGITSGGTTKGGRITGVEITGGGTTADGKTTGGTAKYTNIEGGTITGGTTTGVEITGGITTGGLTSGGTITGVEISGGVTVDGKTTGGTATYRELTGGTTTGGTTKTNTGGGKQTINKENIIINLNSMKLNVVKGSIILLWIILVVFSLGLIGIVKDI